MSIPQTTRLHNAGRPGIYLCAMFAAAACAWAVAQPPSSTPPASAKGAKVPDRVPVPDSLPVPDRASWVHLDCMTSACHAKLASNKLVHNPMTQGACDACHEVKDEATHKFSLVGEDGEVCLDCHDDLSDALDDTDTYLSQHVPVTQGACLACHNPHSSMRQRLLVESFRFKRYGRFDEEQFEICFQCHDAELVTEEDTDEATDFRNGTVNLHHFHVGPEGAGAKGKGRNCLTCHRPHVSEQQHLIRTEIISKTWKMPLKYLRTETGGYCGPACHAARAYDRIKAIPRDVVASPPEQPK